MNYVDHINQALKSQVENVDHLVLFGQNISAGSCISGLCKNLGVNSTSRIINTPNCENTLVGVGQGLAVSGSSGIFIMKQLDFLLLGIDQIVNTTNFFRLRNDLKGSFTIMAVIVDSGYEGAQASINNLADICSIARVDGYTITNRHDADYILNHKLITPGFRLICISQRLFRTEVIGVQEEVKVFNGGNIFQYRRGARLSVVCFNFSLPQGLALCEQLKARGIESSLYSINNSLAGDYGPVLDDFRKTGKLLILDDSKSVHTPSVFLDSAARTIDAQNVKLIRRELSDQSLYPNEDKFAVNTREIDLFLGR